MGHAARKSDEVRPVSQARSRRRWLGMAPTTTPIPQTGRKFERWLGLVFMQTIL